MKNKITLIHLILIVIILGSAHLFMLKGGFYGQRNWIDIPLHIIVGIYLGLIYIWWRSRLGKFEAISYKQLAISLALFGLFGGLVWEGIEISLWKFFPRAGDYVAIKKAPISDTISDLILDSFSSLFWLLFIKPKRENEKA